MKRFFFTIAATIFICIQSFAWEAPDEGMWLPMFVERLNYVDMQKMGLRLTPEEL
jgi:hypothetical protein